MNFFYDAIQRETGSAAPKRRVADQNEAPAPAAPAEAFAEAGGVMSAVAVAPAPAKLAGIQKLTLPERLEKLVAVLTPPILGNNLAAMEKTRVIRTKLLEIAKKKKLQTFLLSSAMPEDGKTLVSSNLAFALSHVQNNRVLLIDCDLRRPALSSFLQVKVDQGLDAYLEGKAGMEQVIKQISPSLYVVPTNPMSGDHTETLHGDKLKALLAFARQNFDMVLIDCPPLFPIADTQILLAMVDAAVLVVRAGQSPTDLVAQSAKLMGNKLVGVVLNGTATAEKHDYYYGYGYGAKAAAAAR